MPPEAFNGLSESFDAHMGSVSVSGVYIVKALISYQEISSEKSIILSIKSE